MLTRTIMKTRSSSISIKRCVPSAIIHAHRVWSLVWGMELLSGVLRKGTVN